MELEDRYVGGSEETQRGTEYKFVKSEPARRRGSFVLDRLIDVSLSCKMTPK